ncbi:MAG: serine/threonine-protein kinase, partial [Frankiaceae bacterium]
MIPPHPDSAVRTVAGRYRLREVLGRGGMGTVWLAEDLLLRREVALKELHFPDTLAPEEQEELRQRSLREAQAAARISSPHAVKVYDVVTDGGLPWIVMERHHGRTLSEIIRADGPRTPGETARIGLAVLAALENAHAAGIVHRDVKPSNVLVRADGHVTLTDFGIARGIEDTTITRTGMIVGSPAYVAPERATGAPALPPSDLWALGATLYTVVEGHPPYDRGDPMHTLAAVMYEEPEPCRAAGPLAPVIRSLLAKNPADRPTIPAARAALNAVIATTDAGTRTLPMDGPVHVGDRTVRLPSGSAESTGAPEPPRLAPPAGVIPPQAAVVPPPPPRPPLRSPSPSPSRWSGSGGSARRAGAVLVVLALIAAAEALVTALRDRPADGRPT